MHHIDADHDRKRQEIRYQPFLMLASGLTAGANHDRRIAGDDFIPKGRDRYQPYRLMADRLLEEP